VTTHGKGFGLHIKDGSFISDYELTKAVGGDREEKRGSRTSGRSWARAGRTARRLSRRRRAPRAVGITVGTRYIHTVTEMVDRKDLQAPAMCWRR
jgi:putative aminopeptidase FrvX